MIYRVKYSAHYTDLWKDFKTLFDAANYAAEIKGTQYETSIESGSIVGLRIEFIAEEKESPEVETVEDTETEEEEPENNSAPTSAD